MTERQRCLDYIKLHGSARSDQIDEALDLTLGRAASVLSADVKSGLLVMCKVTKPGTNRACNEYRYSVAGGGRTTDYRSVCKPRPAPQREESVQKSAPDVQIPVPPVTAPITSPLDDRWLTDPKARTDTPPSERAAEQPHADLRNSAISPPANGQAPRLGAIEKGIPIPPTKRPTDGALRAHLQQLQPGDSFETSFTSKACRDHAKKLGIEITYRPIGTEKDKKRIRVWRTK